ncbi:hypothetical protein ACWF5H_11370 [Arthrobacter sp. NPDC055138]
MTENNNPIPPAQNPLQAPPAPKSKKKKKWPWIVGIVVVLSLIGGIGNAINGEEKAAVAAAEASASAEAKAQEEAERKAEQEAEEKAEAERKAAEEKAEKEAEEKRKKEEAAAEKKAKAEAKKAAAKRKAKIDNAQPVSARQLSKLNKNPDKYADDVLVVYGRVYQFDAATGQCAFMAKISHAPMTYDFEYEYNSMFTSGDGFIDCPKLDDVVEDDIVQMTVTLEESFSYDTQAGGNTTVPKFKVEKISRL